jgi:hypothetical protein
MLSSLAAPAPWLLSGGGRRPLQLAVTARAPGDSARLRAAAQGRHILTLLPGHPRRPTTGSAPPPEPLENAPGAGAVGELKSQAEKLKAKVK